MSTLRSPEAPYHVALWACAALAAFAAGLQPDAGTPDRAATVAAAVLCGAAAFRSAATGTHLGADGIVDVSLLRHRYVPWADVEGVYVPRAHGLVQSVCVRVQLRDGADLNLLGTRVVGRGPRHLRWLDEAADAVRETWIRSTPTEHWTP